MRVLIVDENPTFRVGMRAALLDAGGTVAGEVAGGDEAVRVVRAQDPAVDVVLLDVDLDGRAAISATREITGGTEPVDGTCSRVLLTWAHSEREIVLAALCAGASGCVSKRSTPEELCRALEVVADGGAVFCADAACVLRDHLSQDEQVRCNPAVPALTSRELEVLELVVHGHDNRSIARDLCLSEKTVRNHVSRLFSKLDVTRRGELLSNSRIAQLVT